MIDSIPGGTVEAACEHTTSAVRCNLPDNIAEIGDEQIAYRIYADTTHLVASNDLGQGLDRGVGGDRRTPDQCQ
jgi:hypothetical protein